MRFKSKKTNGYTVYAVSGVNTVSFAIDFEGADTKGLLGFAVEREDPEDKERYFMRGFKVFKEVIPDPEPNIEVTTFEHPVQSFVWDDFTAKPDRKYEYFFYPVKGDPKNLDRSAKPVPIKVRTEPLFSSEEHDVFFNRGVASSQAYARKFHNTPPNKLTGKEQAQAYDWLSRDLDDAIYRFIDQAKGGDTLLACFYEFRYLPVVQAFKKALDRGVDVKIIIDAKENEYTDKKGVFHESYPRKENLDKIGEAGLPKKSIIARTANQSNLQHNKFIVYLKGAGRKPVAVWTGSTNISDGGIFGQANVGHWVRDEGATRKYLEYWNLLSGDPGGQAGDDQGKKTKDNKAFKGDVVAIQDDFSPDRISDIPEGVTPVFSPRSGLTMLETYVALVDNAQSASFITLAFGINPLFKEALKDNTPQSHLTFMLLEKKDVPGRKAKQTYVKINASQNVYQAWGSTLKDPLYQWTRETDAGALGLNTHVKYMHCKFLLRDPLGNDPIVVTGSANFSEGSTKGNDENMLLIRGDRRAADIYFTEFNRLFNHYYFRSVQEDLKRQGKKPDDASLFLTKDDKWLEKYGKGKLKKKRVEMFMKMERIEEGD